MRSPADVACAMRAALSPPPRAAVLRRRNPSPRSLMSRARRSASSTGGGNLDDARGGGLIQSLEDIRDRGGQVLMFSGEPMKNRMISRHPYLRVAEGGTLGEMKTAKLTDLMTAHGAHASDTLLKYSAGPHDAAAWPCHRSSPIDGPTRRQSERDRD